MKGAICLDFSNCLSKLIRKSNNNSLFKLLAKVLNNKKLHIRNLLLRKKLSVMEEDLKICKFIAENNLNLNTFLNLQVLIISTN